MRDHLLGTQTTAFNSIVLGDFYGRIQQYTFGEKEQIDGFSGYQILITLGLNVDFNLKVEQRAPRGAKK